MQIYQELEGLLAAAMAAGLLERDDEIYVRNQILCLLGLDSFAAPAAAVNGELAAMPVYLERLADFAAMQGVIEDLFDAKEVLTARIMNCFLPLPSAVSRLFYEKYQQSPAAATDYFYALSQHSNYIQTQRTAKNISYKADTPYGTLDITINLSKPEKNPKDIARERLVKSSGYPKCLLCVENEGYAGRIGHPARSSHRLIRLDLLGEAWFFQYSPYVYYNEHCIVLSGEHRDMKIDRQSFARLLEFVDKMPHYFVGSNADLPIVGGSILSHDHYQGGRYEFAMAKATAEYSFALPDFPSVAFHIVKWPLAVLRLRSSDRQQLLAAAVHILERWRSYSDPAAEIFAYSGDTTHNTITPIARKSGDEWELDLVLRNNRTSEQYPLGIFHPHPDVQHIKKENIGLIEVMGLAVLPARLKDELQAVAAYLLAQPAELPDYHADWAAELAAKYRGQVTADNAQAIVRQETAAKFLRVLEDAGVFKCTPAGRDAFKRFIAVLA